ncbi:MAG: MBL fold metallo-hydrolase [Gammaproteobacteria bacterium]|nr:MAG: MBL fold metallo-hydrolase [Gammaproteobacteria bacterium]RLA51436.1 MAG: MBL fold metallo-hydrolase [Gammaproteobacteria bacterium]
MAIEISHPDLLLRQLFDRDTFTYTYLLVDTETQEGAIIDAVKEQFERDLQIIKELGIELLYAIETHAHADHITSAGMLRQNTGAKIVFGEAAEIKGIDLIVKDGDKLPLGRHSIEVISTPGHTSGCTSYYIDGIVFTGDALLIRGCGRTDFQQGDPKTLYDNVTGKLFTLPDETLVYPAHDYKGRTSSTIGEEKRWNPRLGGGQTALEFIQTMNNLNLDMPKKINEAVPANVGVGVDYNPRQYVHEDFSMDDLHTAWRHLDDNELIIDNRTPEEYAEGHVPGSVNLPFGEEADHADTLKKYTKAYIYCRSGRRAQTALTNLSLAGVDNLVCVSHTGMPNWIAAGYPVEQ